MSGSGDADWTQIKTCHRPPSGAPLQAKPRRFRFSVSLVLRYGLLSLLATDKRFAAAGFSRSLRDGQESLSARTSGSDRNLKPLWTRQKFQLGHAGWARRSRWTGHE